MLNGGDLEKRVCLRVERWRARVLHNENLQQMENASIYFHLLVPFLSHSVDS